ncbi:hypothetical protein Glove_243g30 [Diversispora epigaea]|uniref:Uncharacterized protein n=1 Tax=Diversispora epigaea TaxID=1348612 RepID=A0A397I949_9GLOM|nr:hypothetical protein Glove_243g30 [Diversispora epigaea]
MHGLMVGHTIYMNAFQYYNKLQSRVRERTYEEILNILLLNVQEKTYEEIMDTHRDTLTNLNITLCRECLYSIKVEEREYLRERTYEEILNILLLNVQEKTYEEIMDTHRDTLTNLNITLCRECLYSIKVEEREYCNSY